MSWLSGWGYRFKITISNTNVDSDLAHFPHLIELGSSVGTGNQDLTQIFDELGNDGNRFKIAVTKADGETELYVEIEKWDDANEKAHLWVSKSDWTVASASATELYIYFDSAHADNTAHVADIGSRPEVWDANYAMVLHMDGASAVAIDDSTNNNNDVSADLGTPGYNTVGKIGNAVTFDGVNERLTVPDAASLEGQTGLTLEAWVDWDGVGQGDTFSRILDKVYNECYALYIDTIAPDAGQIGFAIKTAGTGGAARDWAGTGIVIAAGWQYVVARWDAASAEIAVSKNGDAPATEARDGDNVDTNASPLYIGDRADPARSLAGEIDEIRISKTKRSNAWIKVCYFSQGDGINTFGEMEAVRTIVGLVAVTGIAQRKTGKSISGPSAVVGTIQRKTGKSVDGLISTTGILGRAIKKTLSAPITITGTVSRTVTYLKNLTVTAIAVGAIARKTLKGIATSVTSTGAISRHTTKSIVGLISTVGSVGRHITKALPTAQALVTGTIEKIFAEIFAGGAIVTGTIGKLVKKTISGVALATGIVARQLYDINYTMNMTIRRIFGRVRISYSDPYFSAGVGAEATETGRHTYPDQTVDNVETEAYKWFSLHRNVLDGTFHPLPGNKAFSVGWWSATLGDAGGVLTPDPVLTITLAERLIEQLRVIGDDKLNEYPVDFWVRLYSEGDALEYEWHEIGNTLVTWEKNLSPVEPGIVKLVLTVEKWSRALSVVKIAQFFTLLEETYEGEDGELESIRVLEEREYESPTIPQGNISSSGITVRLNNIDHLFSAGNFNSRLKGYLLNNRAIRAWLGVDVYPSGYRRWFPLGTFYSRDWSAPEGETWAEVKGLDMLDRLRATEFSTSEVYTDKSLQWLAITIMTDAGLSAEDWEIDAALDAIVIPYAWFDRMSHREALRRIAAAAMGQAYCNRDGKIVVEIYAEPATPSFEFTQGNFFTIDHPLQWSQMVNCVQARAEPRVPAVNQVICTDTEAFSIGAGESVTKTHFLNVVPAVDVLIPVLTDADADIVVDSWTAYAWGVVATYKNNGGGIEEIRQIDISGKPLEIQGSRIVVAQDETSIAQNGKQTLGEPISSEFWQTEAKAQSVADTLLTSFKDPRRDVTMRTRGNISLLLGDRIIAPDFLDTVRSEFGVMRQDIEWDGGLEVSVGAQRASDAMYFYIKKLTGDVKVTGTARGYRPKDLETAGSSVVGSLNKKVEKTLRASAIVTPSFTTIPKYKTLSANVLISGGLSKQADAFYRTVLGLVAAIGSVGRSFVNDVGAPAINRVAGLSDGWTGLNKALIVSGGDGTITIVDLWVEAAVGGSNGWKIGTFYGSGSTYTCRDYATLGGLSLGFNHLTGLSIAAHEGDLIGVFIPLGKGNISRVSTGEAGIYSKEGDHTADGAQLYDWHAGDALSLLGKVSGSV